VQVDPIKPKLKAPGTKLLKLEYYEPLSAPGVKRLKLEYDEQLSACSFKFNLRRYTLAFRERLGEAAVLGYNRGMAVWAQEWQRLTLVHFSAQPEPFLTRNTP
jgi:hypothetical protein